SIVDDNGTSTSGIFVTGGGTFVVTGVNLYSGSTVIVDSTVQVSSDVNLGTAPLVFTAGHLIIDGGTLYASSTFTVDANRGILIGDSVVVGTGSFWVESGVVLTVASVIDDNGTGDDGVVKVGPGELKLDGANAYEGTTDVDQGTLNVVGSTTSDTEANAGSTIAGTGDVNGTLTTSSANVLPGTSPGILSTDSVTFDNGSTFGVEIGGATPGNGATNHDQLNVTGTVALGGATLSLTQFNGFVPTNGQTFVIINNDSNDAVTGTFNGLAQGGSISNFLGSGLTAIISYAGGTGNDVVLTAFAPPTVTSVNPTSGPTAGGNSVTITGTNFTGASGVTFGGAACPITSNNGTEIVCTAPAHAAGAVSVEVTTPGGTNAANTLYTYEAETTVTVSGGNLLIEDTNGGNSNDSIVIACTPPNITITDSGTGLSQTILASSVTGSITVNTFGGNDSLTVNLSGCDFINDGAGGGLFFNGGAAGDDALNISGYSGGTTTYNYVNANDGNIVMAGGTRAGTITYTGLEPIANTGTAADVIMNLPAGGSVALLSIPVAGTTRLESSPVTFETTDFATPSNSLTINPGNAADTISVGAMGSGYPSMTLGVTGNRFAAITHTGSTTFASNRNYTAFATGQIQFQTGVIFNITGSGNFAATTDRNILVQGTISFQAGSAVLSANQQVTPTAGNFIGIDFDGGSISSTTFTAIPLFVSGKGGTDPSGGQLGIRIRNGGAVIGGSGGFGVTMTGRGGASTGSASANIGVLVDGTNSRISSTGGGTVQVTGFGGSSASGGSHVGVRVINSGTITSLGSAFINVNGFGGTGSGGAQFGVDVRDGGVISRSFSGQVSVSGTGGDGAGGSNTGVSIVSNGTTSRISSGSGSTIVTGTGGISGSNNDGINMFRAAQITSTNGGTVTVNGTSGAGSSSEGVQLSGSPTFPAINSSGAAFAEISVTGTAAAGIGILIDAGCSVTSGSNANVSLISNSISIDTSSASVSAGTGQVSLRQLTNGVGIDLGSASDPFAGPLSLTDAEIDRVTAGQLNIGNANSGTIIFNSSINLTDSPIIPNLNLTTGGQIQDSFSGTEITVSNLSMTAGTGGIGQSISGALDFQADTVWTNTSGTNSNQFMFSNGQVDVVAPGLNAGSGSITLVGGRWDTTATGGVLSDVVVYGNGANVATLGGIGSVSSSESTTANGGIISPGTSPGILNTGNVSFSTGSIFEVEIGGTTPGNTITNHDQLNVTGTLDLAGAALTLAQFNGFTPTAGQQFVIINNDGGEAILNPFGGVAEGATIAPFLVPTMQATISYVGGDGNDVVLTAQLPPAIITLSDPNPIGFGNVTVGNTSPAQTYNVSGVNLTADIVVTAPTHFEVSLSPTTGFGTSVSIPFGSGTVTNVAVYIRFAPTAAGVFSDPITHTSGAAPQQNKTALGTGVAAVCVAPPSGLTAKYRAENNFLDETGGFNAAGTGSPTFAAGRIGQAFDLNGTTQYVIANPATAMETNSRFSFDAWVNRRNHLNISQHQGLLIKDIGNGSDSFGVFIFNNGTPGNNADDGFYGQYNGGPTFQTANGTVPAANQWFHIAQTYDGITLRLYLNGVQIHSVGLASRTVGTGPLGIGARSNGQHAFNGLIDEVEVYDRTLSATEVAARFNSGPTSGMVAWFKGETNTLDQFGVNNASSTGTPFGYTGGKVGQAFNFGGGTGRVFVNDPGSSPFDLTTGLTIDAWIRPTVAANIGIASKYISSGPATDPFRSYQFYMESTQTVRFRTNRCADVISASTIPLNAWSHVAATFDSTGQCRIYVNGVLDGTPQTASGPLLTNDVAFLIGSTESGTLGNFSGQIDEVQVFSRSLGGSEIAAIYNASTTGKCLAPEIVVEEPVGTDATDNVTVSSFGSTIVGQSGTTKTYTIRNRGTTTLNVNVAGITIDGANAGDFVLNTGSMSPTLAPNGNAFITVQFVPTAGGVRNAALHIPSDDADENPF
ncbi:MAG: LamG-like jellyroll fold domain-containing protein, partial [Pyrinomonadaceae bacterium]